VVLLLLVHDVETGLNYNYFQNYDPEMGRYIQSDPSGLAGGLNSYASVGGNPLPKIDPLGLSPTDVQRILQQFENTVQRMTREGVRSDNWILNNANRDHYICSDQSADVLSDLSSKLPRLDDKWKFSFKDNFATKEWWAPGHIWVEGSSSNLGDPVITMDAWKHKYVLQY
jgi:RHS repeat-associated protein